ncbi:MAG: T9SS type A sorting domain-containing protein [Candidatus Cloacimonetes bacterium]|nr:T9SS type A sorting domain-containing protein [Candidatus Cloacimonadota bacterium]MCF7814565.1 T9SS type A sorting domain-containing protein [Candidatus Cloacimonadota bacterium]MCF7867769.1 T9SS type A sorting domain-containing protein [Candidatus Cloacimonadota bacterium]MCF7883253.1 T9SS type A sorting domain-containing protein [Candidatus Cloacimonadota bacterium]
MKKNLFLIIIAALTQFLISVEIALENTYELSSIDEIPNNRSAGKAIYSQKYFTKGKLFENSADNGSILELQDCVLLEIPGKPLLPQRNIHVTLEGNYLITDIILTSGLVEEYHTNDLIGQADNFLKTNGDKNQSIKSEKDDAIYLNDDFYPKRWLDFTAGFDGNETHIFIHIFPVQWNPINKKTYLLRNFDLSICGEVKQNPIYLSSQRLFTEAEHILLCPSDWICVADSMAQFHDMTSEALDIQEIYSEYPPADEPTEEGWATFTNEDIHDYQYENALRIISYLRDDAAHPNLDHITILGSAEIIPPSYYFSNRPEPNYESWMPSDHYYASPDYDWVDNYNLARLPVHDLQSLSNYFEKMQNFILYSDDAWTNKVAVSGGQTWGTSLFLGELSNNQIICDNVFDGFKILKYQKIRGNFSAEYIKNLWMNEEFLFHFNFSHGGGYDIAFGDGTYLTKDDVALFPPKTKNPIIVDKGCWNGVFDTFLYEHHLFEGITLCETVLSSPGGGIAYIAATRQSYGQPVTYHENGNLMTISYNADYALLYYFLDEYRKMNEPTFGKLFRAAKMRYLDRFTFYDNFTSTVPFIRFMVHANSALPLPIPPPVNSTTEIPQIYLENSVNHIYYDVQIAGLRENQDPIYQISNQDLFDILSYSTQNDYLISYNENIQNSFSISGDIFGNTILNRLENIEEKEAWHYSYIIKTAKNIDGQLDDWNQEEIICTDPGGDICPDLDLTELYADYDAETNLLSFALPVEFIFPEDYDEEYFFCFAIDDEEWGVNNNYLEPMMFPIDVLVGFDNARINKLFVLRLYYNYSEKPVQYLKYYDLIQSNGGFFWEQNDALPPQIEGLYNVSENILEFTISADSLNLDNCKMAVFSSKRVSSEPLGIIMDTIPTSLNSPSEPLFGFENAYSIRDYIDLGKMLQYESGANPIQPKIYANFPNPFNNSTKLKFEMVQTDFVEMTIYNIRGQKVRQLCNQEFEVGFHFFDWNGKNDYGNKLSSGIYFVDYKIGDSYQKTIKSILLK